MILKLKTFSQLIEDMGAALQSSATTLVDVSIGSVIRAIFEANASVVLWLQWVVLEVLRTTRAATSAGTDLDTWMGDFGVSRLPATAASGLVTFSRFASNLPALVPLGTVVKTSDGSCSFVVTEDSTISTWQPTSSGYILPIGVSSTNLPAVCTSNGSFGNVLAGTITVIASSLPGVDQVVNSNAMTNGVNLETDTSFRNRFHNYLASRACATLTAVRVAIANVRQGLNYTIEENTNSDGSARSGSFLVIVDDGSGYPSSNLIASVYSAIDVVRPIGTTFFVIPPNVLSVNVSLSITMDQSSAPQSMTSGIQTCITDYLNSLRHSRSLTGRTSKKMVS